MDHSGVTEIIFKGLTTGGRCAMLGIETLAKDLTKIIGKEIMIPMTEAIIAALGDQLTMEPLVDEFILIRKELKKITTALEELRR